MPKKKTKEEFIKEAKEKHEGKYDYSKVCIICPEHGEFEQTPKSHLKGCGCQKCSGNYIPTKEEWITSAREVHGDKYDYSKVKYVNSATKVCIKCPKHGEFWQTPSAHTQGQGCPTCANEANGERKRLTLSDFIKKANEVHNGKYDYTKVRYVNVMTKVCIICPEPGHGEFLQTPHDHLGGHGCPKCRNEVNGERCRLSKEDFIKKARKIHGDKYNYSKVEYVKSNIKVCIICPQHGEFWQTPNSHTQGANCSKCSGNYIPTTKEWIVSARKAHGDKYDYSKVEYTNNNTKVCIICPEHGEFCQRPVDHINGCGCSKCKGDKTRERQTLTKEEFIKKARNVHGGKYDYTNVKYINTHTKVCIICPEHGEFRQTPHSHIQDQGCPKCNLSHLERSVMNYLDEVKIAYDYQKRFDWLGRQSLDFYLPEYNVGIECQGIQHFEPIERFGGDKGFKKTFERDKRKKALCEKHGVKLLYFGNVPNYDTFLGEMVHDDVQYLIDYLNEHKIDRDKPTTE